MSVPHQDEPYWRLQRLNRDRLQRALSRIDEDLQKHNRPSSWKMLEVDMLLQSYRRAADELREDLSLLPTGVDSAQGKILGGIVGPYPLAKPDGDVETFRSVAFSLNRAAFLLKSSEMWKRVGMAFYAGSAVLTPMIIITKGFPGNIDASIITVCSSTIVFALFVAWTSNSTHQELMGVVATYAAVLVVFVGVSNPTITSTQ